MPPNSDAPGLTGRTPNHYSKMPNDGAYPALFQVRQLELLCLTAQSLARIETQLKRIADRHEIQLELWGRS